jgi:two-component system chemotaxis sensor kinase CheA
LLRIRDTGQQGNVGDALLSLPMPLEDLLNKVAALKGLTGIQRAGRPTPPRRASASTTHIARLLQSVAADSGKQVRPVVRMGSQDDLEPTGARPGARDRRAAGTQCRGPRH